MRLRSRLDSWGRSHTSPYSTVSSSSTSLGATWRTSSRADSAVFGVVIASSSSWDRKGRPNSSRELDRQSPLLELAPHFVQPRQPADVGPVAAVGPICLDALAASGQLQI